MILRAENIQKSYGDLSILKGVNLEIKQNEIVSIVGASGAGKTTLLQILGTLDQPSDGSLNIDGTNPFSLNEKKLSSFRNSTLGFIFQFHQLLPEFTAAENVMLPALIKGLSKKEAEQQALELLEKVGLQDRIKHKPSELSGGEQQRTAVCRALMNKPKVIFGDEPSGNLDTQSSRDLHELFFQLREEFNQTFVLVTHNKELSEMADRSLTMVDGKFVS
jgi:lipoprotein-releasing system ATP-binding protein